VKTAAERWGDEMRLALKVAARFQTAYEFTSPEALRTYLHDHPDADKSKHTVKKPGEHQEKKHEDSKEKGKAEDKGESHEEHGEKKPKSSWKDVMKGLSSKAISFVKKAPEQVQKFLNDETHRSKTLMGAHKALMEAPGKYVKNAFEAAKHEVKEFKEAGEGIKAWMSGKEMSHHQKDAFKKVATHVAIAAAAGALGAGLGAGAAALTKGIMGSFVSSTAKKIAIKAVTNRLQHLPTFEEVGHIGHHGVELVSTLFEKLAEETPKPDADEFMQMLIAAAVAKEIKELEPETIQEALEEASEEV
jgi:hypothetical protein